MDLLIERKVIPKNKAGAFFLGYGSWGRSKPLFLSSKLTSVGVRPHSTLILNMRVLGGSHRRMIPYVDVPPHRYSTSLKNTALASSSLNNVNISPSPSFCSLFDDDVVEDPPRYSTSLKNITLASSSLNNVNTSPSPSFCSLFDDDLFDDTATTSSLNIANSNTSIFDHDDLFDDPPTSSSSKRKCTTDADSDNDDIPYYHSSSSSFESSSLNDVTMADLDTATASSLNIANSNTGVGSKRKCTTASDNDIDDDFPQKKRALSVDDNLPFEGQKSYQITDRQNSGGKITVFNRPDGTWVCYCSSHSEPRYYKNKETIRSHYVRASKEDENLEWKVSNTYLSSFYSLVDLSINQAPPRRHPPTRVQPLSIDERPPTRARPLSIQASPFTLCLSQFIHFSLF